MKEFIKWLFGLNRDSQRGMPRFQNPPPPPMKRKYQIAIELIKIAAKFEDSDESELSNQILNDLIDHIKRNQS